MDKNGKISFQKLFFQSTFKAKLGISFQNSETTFSKQFCPNFFNVFCAKKKKKKKKNLFIQEALA